MPDIRTFQSGRTLLKRARKSPLLKFAGFGGIAFVFWFIIHKGEPHLKISVEKLNIEMSGSPSAK